VRIDQSMMLELHAFVDAHTSAVRAFVLISTTVSSVCAQIHVYSSHRAFPRTLFGLRVFVCEYECGCLRSALDSHPHSHIVLLAGVRFDGGKMQRHSRTGKSVTVRHARCSWKGDMVHFGVDCDEFGGRSVPVCVCARVMWPAIEGEDICRGLRRNACARYVPGPRLQCEREYFECWMVGS